MERVEIADETTDLSLVAQARDGDEGAFTELVRRHQHRAVNVAFQLLRDREDAHEVAQDAFVSVYRHLAEFRGECAFTTWLHQIVVNLARNKHRWWKRRGRAATFSLDAPLAREDGSMTLDLPASGVAPDDEAAQRETQHDIQEAAGRLPRKFREVLVLRNVEELSYDEISKVLRCSVGTVKSRIARAREALRVELKK